MATASPAASTAPAATAIPSATQTAASTAAVAAIAVTCESHRHHRDNGPGPLPKGTGSGGSATPFLDVAQAGQAPEDAAAASGETPPETPVDETPVDETPIEEPQPGETPDQAFSRIVDGFIPQGVPQTADDMAELALYLVNAPHVTGQAINVDGGLLL